MQLELEICRKQQQVAVVNSKNRARTLNKTVVRIEQLLIQQLLQGLTTQNLSWVVYVGPTRRSVGKSVGVDESTEDLSNLWKKIHPKTVQIQLFGQLR